MSIKQEIRRRIVDLTNAAYERGYSDGAQAALSEIESITGEDMVGQLENAPVSRRAIKANANGKTSKARSATKVTAKSKPKSKSTNQEPRGKSKSAIVQEALQALLTQKGEARRDEVLAAAQAANPAVTKHDLNNGLRALAKKSAYRVSPEDSGVLLPIA